MPKKAAPKDVRKRTKKPGKMADLPAKSLKAKDAAKVKGGITIGSTAIATGATAMKIDGTTTLKY